MTQRIITLIAAGMLSVGVAAQEPPVRLHTLDEMNAMPEPLDSHAGEERHSVLEPVFEYMQVIPAEHLKTQGTAIYPRIKRMSDGRYILFCQGGQIASRIYCYTSDDLKTWSEGHLLFKPYKIETSEGPDVCRFSTADAVVLPDGDLLVVCSFRASAGYKHNIDCGLMLRRSSDNGRTWSEEQVIYRGTNWEPYLLVLPDGRIQCYFTDCIPAIRNSGTSVITSTDNGHTWHGHMRICRQYKYEDRGERIFTDQMPCFRLLNDGETLFGFLEARLEPEGPQGRSTFMMSTIRHRGFDWQPLGESGTGPADRETNAVRGCAGYVATFPSGETLVSCNIDRIFSLKIGDSAGRVFNGRSWQQDWFQPFEGLGFWGSLEPLDSHRVIGAMHCEEGIQLGVFYLNHRIDAPAAKVLLDGDGQEWHSGQALFLGGDSPAQVIFRASHDDEHLYLLLDGREFPKTGSLEIRLNEVVLTLGADGALSGAPEARGVCREAVSASGERGFVAEIAVPLSALGAKSGDQVRFWASLANRGFRDTFTFARKGDSETWMRIALK